MNCISYFIIHLHVISFLQNKWETVHIVNSYSKVVTFKWKWKNSCRDLKLLQVVRNHKKLKNFYQHTIKITASLF